MGKKSTPSLDEQLYQKRNELRKSQTTQSNAYSEYIKVMNAKSIVDTSETEKLQKLDELMFQHFTHYQHALEQSKKLEVEISELEAQKYLEGILS